MQERIQEVLNRIKEWWGKFSTKQKALLISIAGVVVVAIGILAFVMTRPQMVELIACESTKQASEVKDLLDGESIAYEVSDDGLVFTVKKEDEATAAILLGKNEIPTSGYSIDNVFSDGFSATEADKNKKYILYLEEKFSQQLATLDNVEAAAVNLKMPTEDGTLIAQQEEADIEAVLTLTEDLDEDQAAALARFLATGVGNETTDRVTIMDSKMNLLYSGGESSSSAGMANSNLSFKQKAENLMKTNVKNILMETKLYDNIEVGPNLEVNFDKTKVTDHYYYVDEGKEQGYLDSESAYESEASGGAAAIPGTDSNDDTTYVMQDGENSSSTISDITKDYSPSEKITETEGGIGNIIYDESSITVVCNKNRMYDEDTLKAQGALDDMTFDEFAAANSERVKMDVDEELYVAVAQATGIPQENISIVAYEVPYFQWSQDDGRTVADYLQIALAVLIFALLGFVVFRSTRKEAEEVLEPEVSVEDLLETTKDIELDDIVSGEKSEIRILIEKFVDENPEAVAALLRNWLSDDWD